jgi:hypothetical protein
MQTASVQLAEAWKDFFITSAGASAALVGLVIVPISVAWGMVATFIFSIVNTWILLVEILR